MRLGPLFHLLIYFLAVPCVACASDSNVTAINGTIWTVSEKCGMYGSDAGLFMICKQA